MFVSEFLKSVIDNFKNANIDNPVLDAQIIFSHVLNVEKYKLTIDREMILIPEKIKKVKSLVKRRLKFEPIAYIIGRKEFYSLDFNVDKSVLIPRPETELLVDMAIYYSKMSSSVLDLGTGSGAIAVSLRYNRRDLDIYASDISPDAIKVAKKNSKRILGPGSVKFFTGDLFEPFNNRKFDMIVTNPPYINPRISGSLQKELSYEPEAALYSENRGQKMIKKIVSESKKYLNRGSILIIEIGHDMKKFIENTGSNNGFVVSVLNDYSKNSRVAVLKRPELI